MDTWLEYDMGGLVLTVLAKMSPDGTCVDGLKVVSVDYPRNLDIDSLSYKGKDLWDILCDKAREKVVIDREHDREVWESYNGTRGD